MYQTVGFTATCFKLKGFGRWERAFTLIELLVVISITAVLLALAAPSFQNILLNNKLTSYANNFSTSVQLARSEAIKRNAVVRVCRSANGTSCATSGTWQQGWIVFNDLDNDTAVNTAVDSTEKVIQVQHALSPDYHFTGDSYSVAFQQTGGIPALVTLSLCRASPAGSQERTVRISATGRTTATKTSNGVCP